MAFLLRNDRPWGSRVEGGAGAKCNSLDNSRANPRDTRERIDALIGIKNTLARQDLLG